MPVVKLKRNMEKKFFFCNLKVIFLKKVLPEFDPDPLVRYGSAPKSHGSPTLLAGYSNPESLESKTVIIRIRCYPYCETSTDAEVFSKLTAE